MKIFKYVRPTMVCARFGALNLREINRTKLFLS